MRGMKSLLVWRTEELIKILDDLDDPQETPEPFELKLIPTSLKDDPTWEKVLWRILSHPRAHVRELAITQHCTWDGDDAMPKCTAMAVARKWCQQIPPKGSRKISLEFGKGQLEIHQKTLRSLRKALTCPNNQVTELAMDYLPTEPGLVDSYLRPILEDRSNELGELRFGNHCEFNEDDLKSLSLHVVVGKTGSEVRSFSMGTFTSYWGLDFEDCGNASVAS